jgi:hypothetical protein
VKRLSIIFFLAALLLAGVAIAAVVVRAGDLRPVPTAITVGPLASN